MGRKAQASGVTSLSASREAGRVPPGRRVPAIGHCIVTSETVIVTRSGVPYWGGHVRPGTVEVVFTPRLEGRFSLRLAVGVSGVHNLGRKMFIREFASLTSPREIWSE